MSKKSLKEEALAYHFEGRPGKIEVIPTKATANQRDLSLAYSPGVADPCLAIHENVNDAYKYTDGKKISSNYKMNKELKNKIIGTLIVPFGLAIMLIPFSMLIGWNLLTLLLFWFVLIPTLTIYLPTFVSNKKNHLFKSSVGLLIFYALMVFMIYDHYQTDYFQVMIFSAVLNLIIVSLIIRGRRLNVPMTDPI